MIIKELVGVESLSKADIKYTIVQLEDKNSHKGKVIFTVCEAVKLGDEFVTNDTWSPIWFKDNLQNYFKLVDIKEYLDISLFSKDNPKKDFVNAVCALRHQYKQQKNNKRG